MAETESSTFLTLETARMRLATVWLSGAGFIFLIVIAQSVSGRYEDKTQEAWNWLLPTMMPTLGLIVSVLGYTARDPGLSRSMVRRSFVHVVTWLSVAYLLLVLATIAMQPFLARDVSQAFALMRSSNLWLGPFQGLVASALGVLFVTKKDSETQAEPPKKKAAGTS